MHFRKSRVNRILETFAFGAQNIDFVQQYKYSILLDEYLKFDICDSFFAKSGGKALSFLIAKYNANKNLNHHIFTHLLYTCVYPVLLYSSEACGF